MRGKWDLAKVSCLVAEDNPHMRTILRSVLAGFGIRSLYEAEDGAAALEVVLDRRPDIILCDWVMKPISGGEFIRILRSDPDQFLSTIPVIVISAHSRRNTILEALETGIHGFVAKPVSPAILYQHIGEALERQDRYGRSKGISRSMKPEVAAPQGALTNGTGRKGASGQQAGQEPSFMELI